MQKAQYHIQKIRLLSHILTILQSSRFYGERVDIHSKLVELLNQSTDEYEGDELVEKFTEIDSWDSLSHAIFIQFEEYVGKALPIDRFADLSDYLTFFEILYTDINEFYTLLSQ